VQPLPPIHAGVCVQEGVNRSYFDQRLVVSERRSAMDGVEHIARRRCVEGRRCQAGFRLSLFVLV
jgi:hypothetical protein